MILSPLTTSFIKILRETKIVESYSGPVCFYQVIDVAFFLIYRPFIICLIQYNLYFLKISLPSQTYADPN